MIEEIPLPAQIDSTSGDPGVWGLLLVDVAHHVANSLAGQIHTKDNEEVSREQILERVKEFFDAEWKDRTDTVRRLMDA